MTGGDKDHWPSVGGKSDLKGELKINYMDGREKGADKTGRMRRSQRQWV